MWQLGRTTRPLLDVFAPRLLEASAHASTSAAAVARKPKQKPKQKFKKGSGAPREQVTGPGSRDRPADILKSLQQQGRRQDELELEPLPEQVRQAVATERASTAAKVPTVFDGIEFLRGSSQNSHAPPLPSPTAQSGTTPWSAESHNAALLSLLSGVSQRTRGPAAFEAAFVNGWMPLRRAGKARDVRATDLAQVMSLATSTLDHTPSAISWVDVRDLVLNVAGRGDVRSVYSWMIGRLHRGRGAEGQVIEIVKAILDREHIQAIYGTKVVQEQEREPIYQGLYVSSLASRLEPAQFIQPHMFIAYIVAHSQLAPSSDAFVPFADFLPHAINGPFPSIWLKYLSGEHHDDLLRKLLRPGDPARHKLASAWVRHVCVAQCWQVRKAPERYARDQEGALVDVGGSLRAYFHILCQQNSYDRIRLAWETIEEAFDPGPMQWLGMSWAARPGVDLEGASLAEPETGVDLARELDEEAGEEQSSEGLDAARPPAVLTESLVGYFLHLFTRYGFVDNAIRVWSWTEARRKTLPMTGEMWRNLLAAYSMSGNVSAAQDTWDRMVASGLPPSAPLAVELASAYFRAKRPREALQELGKFWDGTGQLDHASMKRLMQDLLRSGCREEALRLLQTTDFATLPPSAEIDICGLMIAHFVSRKPDWDGVEAIITRMDERGLEPDHRLITALYELYDRLGIPNASQQLLAMLQRFKPTPQTHGVVIHRLVSSGRPEDLQAATALLEEIEARSKLPNVVLYTTIIQGLVNAMFSVPKPADGSLHPYLRFALQLKDRLGARSVSLGSAGYNILISGAFSLRSEAGKELALELFDELRDGALRPSRTSGVAEHLRRSEVLKSTWYLVLKGLVDQQAWLDAEGVLGRMESSGFKFTSPAAHRLVGQVRHGLQNSRLQQW